MAEQLTLYRFNELTAEAQAKAIVKLRQSREWQEIIIEQAMEDFREHAVEQLMGYGLPTDELYYSFSYSQGEGVAFYGDVSYSDDLLSMLEDAYGLAMPHARVIRQYVEAQGYLAIRIERNEYGYRYAHEGTMRVEIETDDYGTIAEDIILNLENVELEEGTEEYDIVLQAHVSSIDDAFDALQESMQTFIRDLSVELHDAGYAMLDACDSEESAYAYAESAYDFPVLTKDGDKAYIGWDFYGR